MTQPTVSALTPFPYKLRPKFLRPGSARAPSAPPGYAYGKKTFRQNDRAAVGMAIPMGTVWDEYGHRDEPYGDFVGISE